MSGDDDHGPARPEQSRVAGAGDAPAPRARKAKPPPGIITAGGVDMARAHASGIELRDGPVPEPIADQPRVVLAVETDLRKFPTHPRLPDARALAAEGGRGVRVAAMAPATAAPAPSPSKAATRVGGDPAPSAATGDRGLPSWLRLAFALVLLVLLVGLVQRLRAPAAPATDGVISRELAAPPVPAPVTEVERAPAGRPGVVIEPPVAAVSTTVLAPVAESVPPPPTASAEVARRPVRPPPPPPTKSTFTPPFQLPGEKN
jgi:hypothetical protein